MILSAQDKNQFTGTQGDSPFIISYITQTE